MVYEFTKKLLGLTLNFQEEPLTEELNLEEVKGQKTCVYRCKNNKEFKHPMQHYYMSHRKRMKGT
jgi:hypothetical protein